MTGEISKGRYSTMCAEHHQKDEIGELCTSFNQMSVALEQADQERKKHLDVLNKEIAERKKVESDLLLHRTFFEQSTDAMFIADDETRFTYVNPAFSEITGYASEEVIGNETGLLHSGKNDANFYKSIWRKIKKDGYWHGEIWERRKGKENFPALQPINTIRNENGETHYVSIFKDITRLKETENELWKLAHFDQLTNLANRKLLEERINQAISEAYRNKRVGSMIFLDLDNFKHINDSLGHNDGDLMLKEIAARLKAVFRCEDTVARLGGDEYVVLIPDLANDVEGATHATTTVIQKLFDTLQKPFSVKRYELHITTSIGIALFPSDGDTPQKLLRQADTAMYIAKNEGKNTFSFYHSGMQEMADQRLHMEREIRQALNTNEMVVHYQPQYNARYELIGYEALVRWVHLEHGLISPSDFIPVAEESDLILEIGDKVMRDVCKQLIRANGSGSDIPQISVNISSRQFAHLNFIDWVYSILDETGVDPNKLVLEITEGMIIKNLDRTISNMQTLKKTGIRFSVDDFGTGYSSLAYLKRVLPQYNVL
jgi:diguanylate cyclase (GGDEF)-like protein/PAS domain S-box-containing protein